MLVNCGFSSFRRSDMAISGPRLLLPLLLLSSSLMGALSLRFDLQSGHTKCISEDIKLDAMSVGKYGVVVPDGHHSDSYKITAKVTSPYGNNIHNAENTESGNFAFTSTEAGDYITCFYAHDQKPPITLTIEFDWKSGVAAKDWSNIAKKGSIDIMEMELKRLQDTVTAIHDEMFYLRSREDEMQELNRSTNSRMAVLTGVSFIVCLSVAGLQLWHLKTFFERKKLL